MQNNRFVVGALLGALFFGINAGCDFEDPSNPDGASSSVTGPKEAVTGENALTVQGYVRHPDGVGFVSGARVFVVRVAGEETEVVDQTVSAGDYGAFTLSVPELGRYTVLAGYESADNNLMGSDDIWVNGDANPMDIHLAPVAAPEDQVNVSEDGSYETAHQALAAGCWCAWHTWYISRVCCAGSFYAFCYWDWNVCH